MSKHPEPIGWMEGSCSLSKCLEVMGVGLGIKWVGSRSSDLAFESKVMLDMFPGSHWEHRDGRVHTTMSALKLTQLTQGEFYSVHYQSGPGRIGPASGYEGCYVLAISADEAVVVCLDEEHAAERGLDWAMAIETNYCRDALEGEWPPKGIRFTELGEHDQT